MTKAKKTVSNAAPKKATTNVKSSKEVAPGKNYEKDEDEDDLDLDLDEDPDMDDDLDFDDDDDEDDDDDDF